MNISEQDIDPRDSKFAELQVAAEDGFDLVKDLRVDVVGHRSRFFAPAGRF